MEDIKKIQEFFSKPLEEGKQLDQVDFAKVVKAVEQTGHPVTVLLVPKFNEIEVITGMNAPDDMLFDLSNAVDSLGYGRNDIIIAGDSSNLSRREYSDIRRVNGGAKDYFEEATIDEALNPEVSNALNRFIKAMAKRYGYSEQDAVYAIMAALKQREFDGVNEATEDEETEFHKKLDTLVHDTFGKRKGEMEEYNTGIYYKDEKTQDKTKEASKSALEKENEFHKDLDKLVHKTFGKRKGEMEEYNTGIYYKDEKTQDKTKEASKSALEKVKDMIQKVLKEEEGYSQFLKTDDNPEGKTKGLDTATMNKILMNVIKDLDELKQLGEGVIEEELCAKGKAYIKKRQAAGEKSSAYLSGRAVKVCKGQIKG